MAVRPTSAVSGFQVAGAGGRSALLRHNFGSSPAQLRKNFRLTHARAKRLTAYGLWLEGAGGRGFRRAARPKGPRETSDAAGGEQS